MGKLSGKIALVTGGSVGLGFATAKLFAREGAHVFITGRRQAELDAAAQKIGANVTAIQGDVSKSEDLTRLFAAIEQAKGGLDIIFLNAGVYEMAPLEVLTEEHYDKIFDINVKGLIFTVQKALPVLRDGASLIINASGASIKGMAGMSVYAASKAAVRSLARSWILELKDRKIRVNVVSPGMVPTEGYANMGLSAEQTEQFMSGMLPQIPSGRVGTPDEIANATLFLASDDSAYVNGVELFVDGGFTQV